MNVRVNARMTTQRFSTDDRGLIGKILLAWLLLFVLIVVVAIDAGSIYLIRLRTADVAEDAAAAAAGAFAQSGDEETAKLAALDAIADGDDRVRLKKIDVRRRTLTVVVTARAGTLLAGRIPWTRDLAKVTVTETTPPGG